MIGSLTRWVLRHCVLVVVVWMGLASGGVIAAGSLGSAFSQQFSFPGNAVAVSDRIAHEFGTGGPTAPLVGVISASRADLTLPALSRRAPS